MTVFGEPALPPPLQASRLLLISARMCLHGQVKIIIIIIIIIIPEAEFNELFDETDADGSGEIDYGEFIAMLTS